MGHLPDNGLAVVGEVVGGDTDNDAHQQAHGGSAPDPPGEAVEDQGGGGGEEDVHAGGHVSRGVQGPGGISMLADPGGGNADDGGQQAQGGVTEDHGDVVKAHIGQGLGNDQGGGHGRHVGVKQVRSHTGHVAYVVAYVVGDHRRVPGVILGDTQLHLAGEVGGDVGGLGENAAAGLGEQGQGAGAEGEAQQDGGIPHNKQHRGHAEQGEAHHRQAHHSAAPEAHQEGGLDAVAGGLGGAAVGVGGNQDADLTGQSGESGTGQVGQRHREIGENVPIPNGRGQQQEDQHRRRAGKHG